MKDCGRVGGAYFSSPGDTVTKDTVSQAFIHTKQSLNRTISNFFLRKICNLILCGHIFLLICYALQTLLLICGFEAELNWM